MTNHFPSKIIPNPQEMQVLQTIARTAVSSGLYSGVRNRLQKSIHI